MANVWKAKRKRGYAGLVLPALIFLTVLTVFIRGVHTGSVAAREEQRTALYNAIVRATVHCYAIEGEYPMDVAYLEENYGIYVDRSKYIVSYDAFASNIMPTIQVLDKTF